ncbi:hypothetical protein HZA56_21510 [Candidatus Poribacteria bacterium]|nr:hypothetical protein [Candidatus Poribacteria bacterium]
MGTNIAGGASVLTAGLGERLCRSTGRRGRAAASEGATTFGQCAVVTPPRKERCWIARATRATRRCVAEGTSTAGFHCEGDSAAFNEDNLSTNICDGREGAGSGGSGTDKCWRTGPQCAISTEQWARESRRHPTAFNLFSFTAVRPNVKVTGAPPHDRHQERESEENVNTETTLPAGRPC